MEESIFQPYIATRPIFKMDRDILRPSFVPDRLPHREAHVDQLAQILATALRGERPSNVLIYGQTGTGKTAVVKYIENEFKKLEGGRMVLYETPTRRYFWKAHDPDHVQFALEATTNGGRTWFLTEFDTL
ncbi:MAG: AAA family ATPase, partial [Candidatus Thermoplasmatota archaeon]